ncbi:MAG: PCMD domain-containing protein [Tannerellaceae bacterium]|nr:PCMD domain-containing protein [Tannerellaceae bacterium]
MKTQFTFVVALMAFLLLNSCIENDVDYPYVAGVIREFSVEGMSNSVVNRSTRTIEVTITDDVDIQNLTITRLMVDSDASVYPDETKTVNPSAFPDKGFASLDSIPSTADTRVNFTTPVDFLIQTYQDYNWTVSVTQIIESYILFEGVDHPKEPVFDRENKQVIVYVPEGTDLSKIQIENIQITSSVETVSPDPWDGTFNFLEKQEFDVTVFGRTERWTIFVIESDDIDHEIDLFARTKQMLVSGKKKQRSTLEIEYKRKNARIWETLHSDSIKVNGFDFSATIPDLSPLSQYVCRIIIDGEEIGEYEATTSAAIPLENGGFENWHSIKGNGNTDIYCPWATDGVQYWGCGNKGATTVGGASNTTPTTDTSTGRGNAAMLKSVYVSGIKLAAGNLFTGDFVDIDVADGILSFGRPFLAFPTKLKVDYKYTSTEIDRYNTTDETSNTIFKEFIGRPDSCHIYIALTDWDEPREIRTNKTKRQLFDVDDPNIIAYGEFVTGTTITEYKPLVIDLEYRANRVPKYLTIVATSSKYGDYYCGGTGSTLWLDEMELIYD